MAFIFMREIKLHDGLFKIQDKISFTFLKIHAILKLKFLIFESLILRRLSAFPDFSYSFHALCLHGEASSYTQNLPFMLMENNLSDMKGHEISDLKLYIVNSFDRGHDF